MDTSACIGPTCPCPVSAGGSLSGAITAALRTTLPTPSASREWCLRTSRARARGPSTTQTCWRSRRCAARSPAGRRCCFGCPLRRAAALTLCSQGPAAGICAMQRECAPVGQRAGQRSRAGHPCARACVGVASGDLLPPRPAAAGAVRPDPRAGCLGGGAAGRPGGQEGLLGGAGGDLEPAKGLVRRGRAAGQGRGREGRAASRRGGTGGGVCPCTARRPAVLPAGMIEGGIVAPPQPPLVHPRLCTHSSGPIRHGPGMASRARRSGASATRWGAACSSMCTSSTSG